MWSNSVLRHRNLVGLREGVGNSVGVQVAVKLTFITVCRDFFGDSFTYRERKKTKGAFGLQT